MPRLCLLDLAATHPSCKLQCQPSGCAAASSNNKACRRGGGVPHHLPNIVHWPEAVGRHRHRLDKEFKVASGAGSSQRAPRAVARCSTRRRAASSSPLPPCHVWAVPGSGGRKSLGTCCASHHHATGSKPFKTQKGLACPSACPARRPQHRWPSHTGHTGQPAHPWGR